MSPTKTSDRASRRKRSAESGFTLVALIVILTIMAMVIAYSVPQMWSATMKREHDLQTIWAMKQYARAIAEFQRKRGTFPVSLDQLKSQNNPRAARQLFLDPETGKLDWILIPFGTPSTTPVPGAPGTSTNPTSSSPAVPINVPIGGAPGSTDTTGTTAGTPVASGGSAAGAFIGVRPAKTGPSFMTFNGQDHYEAWSYTTTDLQNDQALITGAPTTGGLGMPQGVPSNPVPPKPPAPPPP